MTIRAGVLARYRAGEEMRDLAAAFGVSRQRISQIVAAEPKRSRTKPPAFWPRVQISDGCWEWQGSRSGYGYGTMKIAGAVVYAHRFSWELHFGLIPPRMFVCHHCDNPPCVRPDHLFVGTATDNARDRNAKGRDRYSRARVLTAGI